MAFEIRNQVKPAFAILGRPNVGKSTLFNRITRTRNALVADVPGVTRDVQLGIGRVGRAGYLVVDTGGIAADLGELGELVSAQAMLALEECVAGVFVVDAREGLNAIDEGLARALRRSGKPLFLAVNKAEDGDLPALRAEYSSLGLGMPYPVSAAHGQGIEALVAAVTADWPALDEQALTGGIRVAIVGRPNVGKSTLTNRMLGEERMITCDMPGTTHDSVAVPLNRHGREYTLIDTAGIRRRSRVIDVVEKFSAVKTLQAIDLAQVVVVVMDARDSLTEQDLSVLGAVLEVGRSLVIAVNKWDGLAPELRAEMQRQLDRRLDFVDFAEVRIISALHGTGVGELFASIDAAYTSSQIEVPTSLLTDLLYKALEAHNPPLVHGRRIKLRYAHMGGRNPPTIVIHGNQTDSVPGSYKRYLANFFRKALKLTGTPVMIELRQGENPFEGRRNQLTARQLKKRNRLRDHIQKKK
ncbi:MAG: ribosome biogenesis GTPase Der [Gammaproteobacteria bacterium]|nr:ribosome biogenesis GTPase Der [Gammaproteobacteria bacterium]